VSQEKDNDLLTALGAEGDIWGDPLEALHGFLGSFEMMPDVQAQIEREFLQNESFRNVILNRTDAYPRLLATIQYGLAHRGNVIVAIDGTQRHGKSTVGRWTARTIHQLKTGSADGWEDHVIYEQAYSNTAIRLQEVARRLMEECQGNAEQLLERIRSYCVILDEQWIEHEKDSQKAIDDLLRNILITCAVSGIAFIFISALRRHVGAYFRIWVVGIDSEHQRNLSFYYDMDGFCHGYLVTPNVGETTTYKGIKANAVAEMLLSAGRKAAVVKLLPDEASAVSEAANAPLPIPPDADFLTTLAHYFRRTLRQYADDAVVERWIQRFIGGYTYTAIADLTPDDHVRTDSIGDSIRELTRRIPNVEKGDCLEEATCHYLNSRVGGAGDSPPTPALPTADIFNKPFRRGVQGCDVAATDATGTIRAAINAKLDLEHRASWQLRVHPEPEVAPPHCCWCLHVQLGPPQPTVTVYPAAPPGLLDTGIVEEVAWDAWIEQLRALTGGRTS
jgi:hypothetical protein